MRPSHLLVLAASVSLPAMAQAQEMAAIGDADEGETEDDGPLVVSGNEILVVAPRIRGQLDVPQAPIETFDEEDIAAYGADSIADLIDAISPQTGSGRGRGGSMPVMLVNGQRISSFREMRNIPPEAIKRLEVLPEEVALRFGYPANQRVVNLILKDKFAAATAAGEYNRPTRGGYDNYELESGLFKIAGPRRYNFSAKLTQTSMLTEDERDITLSDSILPTVAGDPDPARYRSLASSDSEFVLNGTMTQGLGDGGLDGQITANGTYTHSLTRSLSGLDTVTLTDPDGASAVRTLPDPLTTRVETNTFEGGLGYNKLIGNWQFSATADGSYTDTNTRVDRERDLSGLVDAAAAGTLAIDGALPAVAGAGADVARNRAVSLTSLATLSGSPFRMPAGPVNLTAKAGFDFDRTQSDDTRNALGTVTLKRGDIVGGLNLAVPLTSRGEDFLGAVGDISLNFSGGIDRLSDFGTLYDWSAGVTWSPTETLTFQASYLVNEAAPTLAQLGAPTIVTYNVPVYDFTNATTALVTVTTGGNPDLVKEKQRDIKLSATWKLPFLDRANVMVEYFRNRSNDVTQSFPLLTAATEAAFPTRVTRDAYGNLVALDRRAVTFDEVASSRIRWGFNIGGRIASSSSSSGSPASGGAPGGAAASPQPAAMSAQPAAGAMGPSGAGTGGPGGFDPARFETIRTTLCTPAAPGTEPDLSKLPPQMAERLKGDDGKIDPARLAQARERICAANGAPGGAGGPPGGFDPARFAALRQTVCAEGTPDLAALPERMQERLKGTDGKIDPERLAQLRSRMCAADGGMPGGPPPGEAPADGARTASAAPAGGPGSPPAGGGARGGGGGPPMFGGPGGGRGGRWNLSVYHTWRFTDTVRVSADSEVLDELAGDALTAGGVPRHAVEAEGGMFLNGYGVRLKGTWNAPARVNGSGAPSSQDLRFGSTFVVDLRLFADLGRNEDLVAKVPFLKGARLSLVAENLLDSRQKVTNEDGETPLAYQRAYREPQGRVIGIDFRKMF